MRLKDKVAIVTGSSRGIGRAICLEFAKEGCAIVTNSQHFDAADKVAQEVRDMGGQAIAVEADVSNKESVDNIVKEALDKFKDVNILVNCAGMSMTVPAVEVELEQWNRALSVNLTSQLLCSQAVAKHMMNKGGGKIVNISSMLAETIIPNRIGYCVPKAAVNHLTRALAIEWAPYKINVNAIGPAYVLTELIKDLLQRKLLDEEKLINRNPFKRFVTEEEVAKTALFFASSEADAITGEYLKIDCGWAKYGGYEY